MMQSTHITLALQLYILILQFICWLTGSKLPLYVSAHKLSTFLSTAVDNLNEAIITTEVKLD